MAGSTGKNIEAGIVYGVVKGRGQQVPSDGAYWLDGNPGHCEGCDVVDVIGAAAGAFVVVVAAVAAAVVVVVAPLRCRPRIVFSQPQAEE